MRINTKGWRDQPYRPTQSKEVTVRHWEQMCETYGWACAYCEQEVAILDMEHMMPKSRGGGGELENIVPACRSCNSAKGNLTPLEWFLCDLGWFRITGTGRQGVVLAEPEPEPMKRPALVWGWLEVTVVRETPQFYCYFPKESRRIGTNWFIRAEREYRTPKENVTFIPVPVPTPDGAA